MAERGESPQEALLRRLYDAAVRAALPEVCLPGHFPAAPAGRIGVIALGKAAAGMARAAARHYGPGASGLIIAPHGETDRRLPGFRFRTAGHPVPDEHSVTAAEAALDLARSLGPRDLLLVLVSGGGSALMAAPVAGVALEQKRELTRQLLACGATIAEINCVRKHLSRVKGGRLAAVSRAAVVVLALSDVPGNDAAVIASGPAIQDDSRLADARAVLARHAVRVPASIRHALEDPANEAPDLAALGIRTSSAIVASGSAALDAAAAFCRAEGFETIDLGAEVEGPARAVAAEHAALALAEARAARRCCILSGGETTVRLHRSPGRGGRNTEYALALALALQGQPGVWAISADTDGIDGMGGHAGAFTGPDTLSRARTLGIDALAHLERSDSATFFERVGGLLVTGPTGTNVSDFRAILVDPAA